MSCPSTPDFREKLEVRLRGRQDADSDIDVPGDHQRKVCPFVLGESAMPWNQPFTIAPFTSVLISSIAKCWQRDRDTKRTAAPGQSGPEKCCTVAAMGTSASHLASFHLGRTSPQTRQGWVLGSQQHANPFRGNRCSTAMGLMIRTSTTPV